MIMTLAEVVLELLQYETPQQACLEQLDFFQKLAITLLECVTVMSIKYLYMKRNNDRATYEAENKIISLMLRFTFSLWSVVVHFTP